MPRQSEAMEVGDISQDLDQAEENDLVEDVYIYLTKRTIPSKLCSKQKKSHQEKSGEIQSAEWRVVLHQEEKQKGKSTMCECTKRSAESHGSTMVL